MNIAAQLNGYDLIIFSEGVTWKKTTLAFNQEKVKADLVVFISNGKHVFYDANSKSESDVTMPLAFCKETISVGEFKRKLKKGGFGEPYEVRLASDRFEIRKEFPDAFTIVFKQYDENLLLAAWLLKSFPVLETAKMLQRLKSGRRYYTKDFAEYGEFENIEKFIGHRFEIWHKATVKEFEEAIIKGETRCEGCNI